ncbi:MAG: glycosyl hydrolase [Patescibacteria group bacterium]|nr:glycosyl hydrolase [Patescibacteria group bacterium]
MLNKNSRKLGLLIFFLFSITLVLAYSSQTLILRQKAEEGPAEVTFSSQANEKIKRIWTNFAQGGEEKQLMLTPVAKEIRELQPQLIRIDHLFDFPQLDQRVEEVINLGAKPMLSLSYFPETISNDLVKMPSSLTAWEELVANTIQRYSGKNGKNLSGIYYEVWNEPDLFGEMNPEVYFSLYQASVKASQRCQNCNPFKIGGPAITSLKKNWLDSFLSLVNRNSIKMDFISWHSYQQNPQKTLAEIISLEQLENYLPFKGKVELIISEWGSLPEVSPLHDSYFDAVHAITAIATIKNSLDKIFAFELKDGLNPEGKKYWGRWGLLTHQEKGINNKPRFFAFLYLNKLYEYSLNTENITPNLATIGSTNGKTAYALIVAGNSFSLNQALNLKLKNLPPGQYISARYLLAEGQNPLTPLLDETKFNGGDFLLSQPLSGSSVMLFDLSRITSAVEKGPGKSEEAEDFSAQLSDQTPPLVFPLLKSQQFNTGNLIFSFKTKPLDNESQGKIRTLWESQDEKGSGISCWLEKGENSWLLHLSLLWQGNSNESKDLALENDNLWHQIGFSFDNQKMIYSLKLDQKTETGTFNPQKPSAFAPDIYFGGDANSRNSLNGNIEDLLINIDNQTVYEDHFD